MAATLELMRQGRDVSAPLVLGIDSPAHPLPLAEASQATSLALARLVVSDWEADLTPWEAPALFRGNAPFGGRGAETLASLRTLTAELMDAYGLRPAALGVLGYSLGGLFATESLLSWEALSAAASVSGSLWYDGYVERVAAADLSGRHDLALFLSLGTKERRAGPPRLKRVGEATDEVARELTAKGVAVTLRLGPGGHVSHVVERLQAALTWLDETLGRESLQGDTDVSSLEIDMPQVDGHMR